MHQENTKPYDAVVSPALSLSFFLSLSLSLSLTHTHTHTHKYITQTSFFGLLCCCVKLNKVAGGNQKRQNKCSKEIQQQNKNIRLTSVIFKEWHQFCFVKEIKKHCSSLFVHFVVFFSSLFVKRLH